MRGQGLRDELTTALARHGGHARRLVEGHFERQHLPTGTGQRPSSSRRDLESVGNAAPITRTVPLHHHWFEPNVTVDQAVKPPVDVLVPVAPLQGMARVWVSIPGDEEPLRDPLKIINLNCRV